jgi:hypothetical protein
MSKEIVKNPPKNPPFTITSKIVNLIAKISEQVGALHLLHRSTYKFFPSLALGILSSLPSSDFARQGQIIKYIFKFHIFCIILVFL